MAIFSSESGGAIQPLDETCSNHNCFKSLNTLSWLSSKWDPWSGCFNRCPTLVTIGRWTLSTNAFYKLIDLDNDWTARMAETAVQNPAFTHVCLNLSWKIRGHVGLKTCCAGQAVLFLLDVTLQVNLPLDAFSIGLPRLRIGKWGPPTTWCPEHLAHLKLVLACNGRGSNPQVTNPNHQFRLPDTWRWFQTKQNEPSPLGPGLNSKRVVPQRLAF